MSDYTPDPYDKTLYEKDQRIRELEAALRKKGHAPNCDLDPCDCGLDAVLTPAKTAEPTGTDSKCPHGHWKAYCDLCLLATAERRR